MSQVKILFTGCEKVAGIKKDNGAPYGPFYQVHYVVPLEEMNNEKRQVSGIGHVPKVASVDADVFQQFTQCKPMSHVTINIGADPRNFSRTVISGVAV